MKAQHSIYKMFNLNFLILLIVLSIFVFISFGCGGGSSDEGNSNDTTPDNSTGGELSGDPGSLALEATYDFDTGTGNPEAEIEDDPQLGKIVRSILEIGFSKEATVSEVNELLDSIDGRIISMIEGVAIIIVRIPDPGSIPALEKVIQDVESNPIVRFVGMGHIPEFSALPNNYVYDHTDMTMIDHNLAVRGHAAWNLRNALQNIGLYSPPMIIVPDLFGKGRPVSDYGFDVTGTDFETASTFPDDELHGYHVIGIIGADYGGSNTDRGWATGLYPAVSPDTLQLRVIDFASGITDEETDNRLIRRIKENLSHNIVVNTSYGFPAYTQGQVDTFCVPEFAKKEALKWIEKVRDAGVEGKFVHITAAGNTWIPGDTDANVASRYGAAKLLEGLEDCWLGVYPCTPVDNITNVLVVENQRNSTDTPYRPICLNFDSKLGGDISGIGTAVWSLLDPAATAGNLSGTSMASPQVAALAAYVWALKPTLSNQDVIKILANTSRQAASWDPSLHADCSNEPPSPIIDAYAAVLGVDTPSDTTVRKTLLDIANNFGTEVSDGNFNEHDIELLLANIEIDQGDLNYSRYDLNGDGYTGGDKWERFDLDVNNPPIFTNVTQDIEGTTITFNEEGLTDMEVLCYYAYSDMYSGDIDKRKSLLDGKCSSQSQPDECEYLFYPEQEMYLKRCPDPSETFRHVREYVIGGGEMVYTSDSIFRENATTYTGWRRIVDTRFMLCYPTIPTEWFVIANVVENGNSELINAIATNPFPSWYKLNGVMTGCYPDYQWYPYKDCGEYKCPDRALNIPPTLDFPGDCHQWWDHYENGVLVQCSY